LNSLQQYRYDRRSLLARPLARSVAALVVACTAAACQGADSAPPVANLTVTPARSRVPVGGPLELAYRFEVQPGTALDTDYTVFVHMVDADGRQVWGDDHQPVPPTSEWKPGETVQYTRTRFLPTTGLKPGDVTIRVGLYKDQRLPLQATTGPARDRAYPVASLQLAPDTENTFLIYTSGWHDQEHVDDGSRSWTWTQRVGALSFKNPRSDVTFYLEYDTRPDAFSGKPQQVTVLVAGQPVGSFSADTERPRLERITIPAAALGTADMVDLKIEVDRTFVPATLPAGGRDARELGIRVYHAFVERR
jgi:hypothetical protein